MDRGRGRQLVPTLVSNPPVPMVAMSVRQHLNRRLWVPQNVYSTGTENPRVGGSNPRLAVAHPIFGGTFAFSRNRFFGSYLALRVTSRSKLAP